MLINAKISSIHSNKKNKDYPTLEVTVGKFKKNILLSDIEEYYLKAEFAKEAHKDFKEDLDDEFSEED